MSSEGLVWPGFPRTDTHTQKNVGVYGAVKIYMSHHPVKEGKLARSGPRLLEMVFCFLVIALIVTGTNLHWEATENTIRGRALGLLEELRSRTFVLLDHLLGWNSYYLIMFNGEQQGKTTAETQENIDYLDIVWKTFLDDAQNFCFLDFHISNNIDRKQS